MSHHTITVTTPTLAEKAGYEVPSNLKGLEDFILVYDRDDDLVAWGPESERSEVMRLAKVYA